MADRGKILARSEGNRQLIGAAEIDWSPKDGMDWNEYPIRLGEQARHLEARNLNICRSPRIP
jgi:hypothetical protein